MYCPECGAEYRPGFYRCADCNVELAHEPPPELAHDTTTAADGVVVFASIVPGETDMVAATLEHEGVLGTVSRSIAGGMRLGILDPGLTPGRSYALSVPRTAEARARAIIALLRPDETPDPPPLPPLPQDVSLTGRTRRVRAISALLLAPYVVVLVIVLLILLDWLFQ